MNTTNITIQILMLNDLLQTKVIDQDIYDKAIVKIYSTDTDAPAA